MTITRSRRAASNTGMLILLGVLVAVIGGYWLYGLTARPSVPVADADSIKYPNICTACGYSFEVPKAEYKTWPKDDSGMLECPKCKKKAAVLNRPGTQNYVPAGKGG